MRRFLRFLLAIVVVNVGAVIFAAIFGFGLGFVDPGLGLELTTKVAAALGLGVALYAGYRVSGV